MPGIYLDNVLMNLVHGPQSSVYVPDSRSHRRGRNNFPKKSRGCCGLRALRPIHESAKCESGSFNMDRLRALRVTIALVQHRMEEDEAGCLDVLQTG